MICFKIFVSIKRLQQEEKALRLILKSSWYKERPIACCPEIFSSFMSQYHDTLDVARMVRSGLPAKSGLATSLSCGKNGRRNKSEGDL